VTGESLSPNDSRTEPLRPRLRVRSTDSKPSKQPRSALRLSASRGAVAEGPAPVPANGRTLARPRPRRRLQLAPAERTLRAEARERRHFSLGGELLSGGRKPSESSESEESPAVRFIDEGLKCRRDDSTRQTLLREPDTGDSRPPLAERMLVR
jgi:hypothetical protein